MDCLLTCTTRCPRQVTGREEVDTPVKFLILMDCVLTRTTRPPRQVTGREEVDTPVKFLVSDVQLLEAKFDKRCRSLVVVVPEAAVHFNHRERLKESVGDFNRKIAMDTL